MHEREPVDEGMEAFSRLLQERTGYPKRGSLAELERISGIYGPMIGRWIRQEVRPTDANLRRLAPALGLSFADLWRVLNPTSAEPQAAAPEPDALYRLSSLLEEVQQLVVSLRAAQAVEPIRPRHNGPRRPLHKRPIGPHTGPNSTDRGDDPELNRGVTAPLRAILERAGTVIQPIRRQLLVS